MKLITTIPPANPNHHTIPFDFNAIVPNLESGLIVAAIVPITAFFLRRFSKGVVSDISEMFSIKIAEAIEDFNKETESIEIVLKELNTTIRDLSARWVALDNKFQGQEEKINYVQEKMELRLKNLEIKIDAGTIAHAKDLQLVTHRVKQVEGYLANASTFCIRKPEDQTSDS